jgi:putative ABC transport system ATP-binding protein
MPAKKIIELNKCSKIYNRALENEVKALFKISLEIYKGEFVAIIGASGSGKSTLMYILGCLDRPSEGKYYLDNIDVSTLEDKELAAIRNKKMGFVFQMFNLLPKASALENVELPLIYSDTENIRIKAKNALENVNLANRINHYPNELSGGQQQRVAIARAIVNNPEIILADEPTGNLDTKSSFEVMSIFQQLNKKENTIILITHEPNIAIYAKRIIKISDGKIVSDKLNNNQKELETVLV